MNTDDPSRAEPAPPPAAPLGATRPRRMLRDPHGPIGGVASGFAAYFDIDPVITRLLWVVALLSGIGLPAYILCWIVIPKANTWPPADVPARGAGAGRSGTLLSGLVIVALAAWIGAGVDGLGQYLLPAALIGFGVYLLNRRPEPAPAAEGAAPGVASPDAADGDALAHGIDAAADPAEAAPSGPPLTAIVLSVLGIGAGVLLALEAAGVLSISLAALAGGGLVIVGAGLLASLWLGPAPRLVPIGLGLAGLMLASSAVGGWFDGAERFGHGVAGRGGVGEQTVTPLSLAELEPRYEHGAGKLTVDLGALELTGEPRELEIDLGVGELLVLVPEGAAVEVEGEVGMGHAILFGQTSEGVGVQLRASEPGDAAGSLRLDLDVGVGEVEVRHAAR